MRTLLLAVAVVVLLGGRTASAATLHVPGDYPNIQAGINAAANGDVVELADGIFFGPGNGDLDFHGKAIVVRSASGNPGACIVDGQLFRRGFFFHSGETAAAVVENIEIRSGYGIGAGGIRVVGASPTIRGCVLYANVASGTFGGAVEFVQSSSRLEDTTIRENSGGRQPTGVVVWESPGVVVDGCVIRDHVGGQGLFAYGSTVSVTGCTIVRNQNGGIVLQRSSTRNTVAEIDRTIVALNGDLAVRCASPTGVQVTISCSDFHGNIGDWFGCVAAQQNVRGNFSLDAMFCDPLGGDFHLYASSPCAPPGATGCGLVGALDVACGGVAVDPSTWGRQKAVFR